MEGYVARKGERWYAVIYQGLDPVTGKECRNWHPAGTNRENAERLAASVAAELNGRHDGARSLTFGVYLTARWLPGKNLELPHHLGRVPPQHRNSTCFPRWGASQSAGCHRITSKRCMTTGLEMGRYPVTAG